MPVAMQLAKRCRTKNAQVQLNPGFSCGTLSGQVGIAHVPSSLSNSSWLENAANSGRAKQLDTGVRGPVPKSALGFVA